MAPAAVIVNGHGKEEVEGFSSRKLNPQDDVHFDPSLAPPRYQIKGTVYLTPDWQQSTIH